MLRRNSAIVSTESCHLSVSVLTLLTSFGHKAGRPSAKEAVSDAPPAMNRPQPPARNTLPYLPLPR